MNQVVYASKGGNTKKVAESIAKGAGAAAQPVGAATHLENTDILFVGSGIYAGKIDGAMREFLQGLKSTQVKRVVVFSTASGKKRALPEIQSILLPNGIAVSEEDFHCRGAFLLANRGRPNAEDLQEAERFAKRHCEG